MEEEEHLPHEPPEHDECEGAGNTWEGAYKLGVGRGTRIEVERRKGMNEGGEGMKTSWGWVLRGQGSRWRGGRACQAREDVWRVGGRSRRASNNIHGTERSCIGKGLTGVDIGAEVMIKHKQDNHSRVNN